MQNDKNWQDWSFLQLCEALRSWTQRNPLEKTIDQKRDPGKILETGAFQQACKMSNRNPAFIATKQHTRQVTVRKLQ